MMAILDRYVHYGQDCLQTLARKFKAKADNRDFVKLAGQIWLYAQLGIARVPCFAEVSAKAWDGEIDLAVRGCLD